MYLVHPYDLQKLQTPMPWTLNKPAMYARYVNTPYAVYWFRNWTMAKKIGTRKESF